MTVRDQERFDFIYRKYYKDLTNETFTILLTRFDRMQQHPNIGGWLYTVLSNLTLNEKNGIGAFSCRMKYLIQIKKYCVYATYKI